MNRHFFLSFFYLIFVRFRLDSRSISVLLWPHNDTSMKGRETGHKKKEKKRASTRPDLTAKQLESKPVRFPPKTNPTRINYTLTANTSLGMK